mmetsp:Transcript_36736/g.57354  ORF Transcript_36736/g.57354 Transcript_36736/m.57354 type:complete len:330 (+) Transcript_36736:464-1453(+)
MRSRLAGAEATLAPQRRRVELAEMAGQFLDPALTKGGNEGMPVHRIRVLALPHMMGSDATVIAQTPTVAITMAALLPLLRPLPLPLPTKPSQLSSFRRESLSKGLPFSGGGGLNLHHRHPLRCILQRQSPGLEFLTRQHISCLDRVARLLLQSLKVEAHILMIIAPLQRQHGRLLERNRGVLQGLSILDGLDFPGVLVKQHITVGHLRADPQLPQILREPLNIPGYAMADSILQSVKDVTRGSEQAQLTGPVSCFSRQLKQTTHQVRANIHIRSPCIRVGPGSTLPEQVGDAICPHKNRSSSAKRSNLTRIITFGQPIWQTFDFKRPGD